MFVLLQVYSESPVELSDGAGKHHRSPPEVFLHDCKAMCIGEFFNCCNVCRIGSELFCKILSLQGGRTPVGLIKLLDVILQCVGGAAAQQHAHFESLGGVGLAKRSCTFEWLSLTAR